MILGKCINVWWWNSNIWTNVMLCGVYYSCKNSQLTSWMNVIVRSFPLVMGIRRKGLTVTTECRRSLQNASVGWYFIWRYGISKNHLICVLNKMSGDHDWVILHAYGVWIIFISDGSKCQNKSWWRSVTLSLYGKNMGMIINKLIFW
jgi:hypothetical protein